VHGRPIAGRDGALGMAAGDDIMSAFGAATALAGNTQFELDVIESQTLAGKFGDGFVANAVANTNNHGGWRNGPQG
jgi:hypothetical protein